MIGPEPTKEELEIARRLQLINDISSLRSKLYALERRVDSQSNQIIGLLLIVTALVFVVEGKKKMGLP